MAEGLLTVLVGDETRQVHTLRGQDKTYQLDVLLGLHSDSFDALGLVSAPVRVAVPEAALVAAGEARVGSYAQQYPPFSQAKVQGVSLLALSHAGVTVERPTAQRRLHAMTWQGLATLTVAEACSDACARIARVQGPFRQDVITARWRAREREAPEAQLLVASWTVTCSAGTYMRTLAHDLGVDLGLPAMAWRIRRTAAGPLTLEGARTLPP